MILFDFEQMCIELKAYKEIIIYGGDGAAKFVKDECLKRKREVTAFITHNPEQGGKYIDGIPVYLVNSIPRNILSILRNNKCLTLIMEGDPAEANLRYMGVKQYKRFADYHIASEHIKKKQGNWDKKKWLQHIDKWYEREHENDFKFIAPQAETSKDKALLLVLNSGPRVNKVIRGLKHHNIDVESVFFEETVQDKSSYETTKNESAACHVMDSFVDIIHLIAHSDAKFIMMFSHVWYFGYLLLFRYIIERKKFLCPVVFDEYDVGQYYFNFDRNNLAAEKDCIEMADIVTDRAYEVSHLIETGVYKLQGKRVQLMDCCEDIPIPNVILKDNRPLSLVMGGSILTDEEYPGIAGWHSFAEDCKENKCHVHIYTPAGGYEKFKDSKYAEYIRMSKENEYFHFHEPVSYGELLRLEAKCDYGLSAYKKNQKEASYFGQYTIEKLIYAPGNRFYDYINIGLPIVGNSHEKLIEYFEELGVAIKCGTDDMDFEYLKAHRDEYRARVPAVKAKLLMKDHIVKVLELVK